MPNPHNPILAVHGGAGALRQEAMSPEREVAYRSCLQSTLDAGLSILQNNGSALDAIERAVRVLEDDPLFNAGRGAVFTHNGRHEMDASIMDGATLKAGAVAAVRNVRNPISLARMVMDATDYVMLAGDGAEEMGRELGATFETDEYFYDEFRYQQYLKAHEARRVQLDHSGKMGTVGAVALDAAGNLAAATSTGGMTNKRFGRIGDSPIIGAGTYANNRTCAISCTGQGEYFIRTALAYDISCRMEYAGATLEQACEAAFAERLALLGGQGGLIAIDAQGNVCLPFNTDGMFRAWIDRDGISHVAIYGS